MALKKVPQKPRSDKPLRLPIPHPIYSAAAGSEVCLFVKDHKGEASRTGTGWWETDCKGPARSRAGALQAAAACLHQHLDAHPPSPSPYPAGEGHKAGKAKVREERIAGISKVIGISKLKTKYESHEAKRQLAGSYDLFAADERVLPSLPKLLGASEGAGGQEGTGTAPCRGP